ncbi:MAG TPA: dihydrofolate reductase [Sandaracinaceae bacterium]
MAAHPGPGRGLMRVSLIAAVAKNGVIGKDGGLPWRLPDDLKQFKARTTGHPVLMGRKTWESLGRPLPGRLNLVVTRQRGYRAPGAEVFASIDEALARAEREDDEVWIIGGAGIYAATLDRADRLVITHVDAEVEGDARFPEVDWSAWRLVSEDAHPADERHAHSFRVATYERARG